MEETLGIIGAIKEESSLVVEEETKHVGPAKKGEKGRNKHGQKGKPPPEAPKELPVVESETELEAMKCLMLDPEPKTKQQWLMKRLLSSNPEKFLDRKLQLEKLAGPIPLSPSGGESITSPALNTGSSPPAPSAPDLGTQRVGLLVEKLLAEWGET